MYQYLVVLVTLGCIPGYSLGVLLIVYFVGYILSGMYPGTKVGCFDHTRVYTGVPLGYATSSIFSRVHILCTKPGVLVIFGYISWVPPGYTTMFSRVHTLGYAPGFQAWMFGPHSGIYPGTPWVSSEVRTRAPNLFFWSCSGIYRGTLYLYV